MATLRRFNCDDLFTFNNINLDVLTETVRESTRAFARRGRVDDSFSPRGAVPQPVLSSISGDMAGLLYDTRGSFGEKNGIYFGKS